MYALLHGYPHQSFLYSYTEARVNFICRQCCHLVVQCCLNARLFFQPRIIPERERNLSLVTMVVGV